MPTAMPTKKRLSSQTGVKIDNSIKLKIPKHYGKPLAQSHKRLISLTIK